MLSMAIGVHHVWRHCCCTNTDDDKAVCDSPWVYPFDSSYHNAPPPFFRVNISAFALIMGDLMLLACFLMLPLAALLWENLSFTIAIGTLCFSSADVHMHTLFTGVFDVLLSLGVLTLLIFWDVWCSPAMTEPEEGYARGVGKRKSGCDG